MTDNSTPEPLKVTPREALLACPFCDGEAWLQKVPGGAIWPRYCHAEACPVGYDPPHYLTEAAAIKAGNTRAAPTAPLPAQDVAGIEDALRHEMENNFDGHCYTITQDTLDAAADVLTRLSPPLPASDGLEAATFAETLRATALLAKEPTPDARYFGDRNIYGKFDRAKRDLPDLALKAAAVLRGEALPDAQ